MLFAGLSGLFLVMEKIAVRVMARYVRLKGLNYRTILIVGTDRWILTVVIGVVSVVLIIVTEVVLPRDTGFESPTLQFVTSFAGSVVRE